jgi:hypothetical protein
LGVDENVALFTPIRDHIHGLAQPSMQWDALTSGRRRQVKCDAAEEPMIERFSPPVAGETATVVVQSA